MSGPRRSRRQRLSDWWWLRRGRIDRVLVRFDPLGGPGDPSRGEGVREPRRPVRPSLSGAAAVEPSRD